MESEDAVDTGMRVQATRVEELRAGLTTRLDVEALLAEAGATRQAAARDADAILAEAQRVATDLLSDSRREVERRAAAARAESEEVIGRARADAETIRNRAEADVESYRRRVREELAEQVARDVAARAEIDLVAARDRSESMIGDLAASVRILGVALETAQANVGEMLAALDELRLHALEGVGAPPSVAGYVRGPDEDEADDDDDPVGDHDAPVTAMDAYLRFAHVDFGDPPLPAVDDSEVGERYARDAERRPGPARTRGGDGETDGETEDTGDAPGRGTRDASDDGGDPAADHGTDRDADGEPGRPLGWLFRSAP